MVLDLREELDRLLSEPVPAAVRRQAETFDREAGPHARSILVFGAGRLGRSLVEGLRRGGIEPLAFSDNNPSLWARKLDGLDVLAPKEAAERFGARAAIVVAVWNPAVAGGLVSVAAPLWAMGCQRVLPFVWLYWKYPAAFLPYYLWDLPSRLLEDAREVRAAFDLLGDPESQALFVRQVRLRLQGDFSCLSAPAGEFQYFPEDLYRFRPDECFVDCGAYDGDTIRTFQRRTGGRYRKVVAFEPDPDNFSVLESRVSSDEKSRDRVVLRAFAVGAVNGKIRFASDGLASAAVNPGGNVDVDCVTLDRALAGETPTLIKMDIEGSEIEGLEGGKEIIGRDQPVLAICVYHRQDHLWRVPLLLKEMLPDARLHLRPYGWDGFDLACYAVPESRRMTLPTPAVTHSE